MIAPTGLLRQRRAPGAGGVSQLIGGSLTCHAALSSYGEVWEILEEADEDPANPSNVIGFYASRSIPKADRDRGGNTPDFWN